MHLEEVTLLVKPLHGFFGPGWLVIRIEFILVYVSGIARLFNNGYYPVRPRQHSTSTVNKLVPVINNLDG